MIGHAESNELSTGWGEAAGDALFNLLVGLELVDVETPAENPALHMIGHSFGTAVTSEAVERLAFFDVPVDQVTYLDPHDFDEENIPVDQNQRLFDLGKPDGYGATVWDNVEFSDVYYQTRPVPFVPQGRPIPGAYNEFMNEQSQVEDTFFPHSAIWTDFYIDTVLDASNASDTGYSLSRVGQIGESITIDPRAQFQPNFYAASQDHANTPEAFRPANVPLEDRLGIASAKQTS